jgi:hypothetical protein
LWGYSSVGRAHRAQRWHLPFSPFACLHVAAEFGPKRSNAEGFFSGDISSNSGLPGELPQQFFRLASHGLRTRRFCTLATWDVERNRCRGSLDLKITAVNKRSADHQVTTPHLSLEPKACENCHRPFQRKTPSTQAFCNPCQQMYLEDSGQLWRCVECDKERKFGDHRPDETKSKQSTAGIAPR